MTASATLENYTTLTDVTRSARAPGRIRIAVDRSLDFRCGFVVRLVRMPSEAELEDHFGAPLEPGRRTGLELPANVGRAQPIWPIQPLANLGQTV